MRKKALVKIQTTGVTVAHEPTVEAVLLQGVLGEGMEAIWEGAVIIITSLQTLSGEIVQEFIDINQSVSLTIEISDPSKLQALTGQNLTFSSEQSIPVIDSIQSWQTESTT